MEGETASRQIRVSSGSHLRSQSQLPTSISQLPFSKISASRDPKIFQNENVHLGAQKTIERFLRITDNRFVFVKRGVEQEGDAGQIAKMFDQTVITRVGLLVDSLQSA